MARIIRKEKPAQFYYAHRNYLKYLRRDFKDRCAYSMQHEKRAGGISMMAIDHHDPTLPMPSRNRYENLFLATGHCNSHKSDKWESSKRRQMGFRFLNPCVEDDYGSQIFEDPISYELWGSTPAARYHIRELCLNADHLVEERRKRHYLRSRWKKVCIVAVDDRAGMSVAEAGEFLSAAKTEMDLMIHDIPQRPKPALPD